MTNIGNEFTRDDGRAIRVVPGFRQRVARYSSGIAVNPRPTWTNENYAAAVQTKIAKHRKRVAALVQQGIKLEGARVLEVGCGAGVDCILMSLEPVQQVVGVDMRLRLFADDEEAERNRRLVRGVLEACGLTGALESTLARLRCALMWLMSLIFLVKKQASIF